MYKTGVYPSGKGSTRSVFDLSFSSGNVEILNTKH